MQRAGGIAVVCATEAVEKKLSSQAALKVHSCGALCV